MMQLEVILYSLGRLLNIPTNWYWYFNICFCSNAQFLTPRETLDSYRKKNSLQNQYQLRLFWICASVWLVWSPWAGYVKTYFPSFLRIRAPVKSSELRTWILQGQQAIQIGVSMKFPHRQAIGEKCRIAVWSLHTEKRYGGKFRPRLFKRWIALSTR